MCSGIVDHKIISRVDLWQFPVNRELITVLAKTSCHIIYRTEPYAQALAAVINEYKPEIMLVGATAIGRDLGPTVSARVATGLTADCTKLEIGDFLIIPTF